jgi:hypothetical protein
MILYEIIDGIISFGHYTPGRIAATVKTDRPVCKNKWPHCSGAAQCFRHMLRVESERRLPVVGVGGRANAEGWETKWAPKPQTPAVIISKVVSQSSAESAMDSAEDFRPPLPSGLCRERRGRPIGGTRVTLGFVPPLVSGNSSSFTPSLHQHPPGEAPTRISRSCCLSSDIGAGRLHWLSCSSSALLRDGLEALPARPHFSVPADSLETEGPPQTTIIGVVKPISSILASLGIEFIIASPLGVQAMWCLYQGVRWVGTKPGASRRSF